MAEIVYKELTVDNLFDCCAMLDAIGTDEILAAFDKREIGALMSAGKDMNGVGVVIGMKICGIVIKKLPTARKEICAFIAGCVEWDNGTEVTVDEILKMKMGNFIQLIKNFFKQDDVTDFFKDVAGFVGLDEKILENLSGTDTATEQPDT